MANSNEIWKEDKKGNDKLMNKANEVKGERSMTNRQNVIFLP